MTMFDDRPILPPDPADLEILHQREYRVRAYRFPEDERRGDRIVVRGAVCDQKPVGLYLAVDPDPLTIHHMQVELHVEFPSMVIVEAHVLFEAHPHETCPAIAEAYCGLVGLSIARGFTHRVRELFGGPRGCTHTTALLLAMAPVAIQCIWSMQASDARRAGLPAPRPDERSDKERAHGMAVSLNSCHVWDADGDLVAELRSGGYIDVPIPMRRRFQALGIDPATRRPLGA